jgi:hypothetical protein
VERIRDRFWVWGHEAGSHGLAEWGLPEPSRVTPVEGAHYLGVPNIIMVRYGDKPAPPYHQYAVPFRSLKQVVWSIVGAGGATQAADREHVLALRDDLPNLTGVMMDDFFKDPAKEGALSTLSLDELRDVHRQLAGPGRKLDLWVVLYARQLGLPVGEHLALCDKVTFWTWAPGELANLDRNLTAVEKLAPRAAKVLGCYMWDYDAHRPMPVEAMKYQCALGLRWLGERRIEGLIFLATCIADLDLEAVEWTRRWIAEVGDQAL